MYFCYLIGRAQALTISNAEKETRNTIHDTRPTLVPIGFIVQHVCKSVCVCVCGFGFGGVSAYFMQIW